VILKSHNEAAYKKVMTSFETSDRTCVCHPTGTGKSYIVAAVTEHFKKVLILAPNNFVLRQQKSVIPWRKDIEYRTYQWLMGNVTDLTAKYDLIVFDEFHRAGAREWSAAVELLVETQPQAKFLGTSATPIRYLDDERNMADELFDNRIASEMTIAEAWNRNILPTPTYVTGIFKFDQLIQDTTDRINRSKQLSDEAKRERIYRLSNKKLDWEKSIGMGNILRRHLPKDLRRVIVFCSHIEELDSMKSETLTWFREAGFKVVGSYVLHSDMKDSEQAAAMRGFESDNDEGVKIIFSVNMLNEGVHVPRVGAVIMLRTTSSRIIYMQQMGRALTTANTEKPVVLDMVDNITTTTAIREYADEFERLEMEHHEEGHEPRHFKVFDYTLGVQQLISKLMPQQETLGGEERLALVKKFIEEHGHAPRQGQDGIMFTHWRFVCQYMSDREDVLELRRKYGYIPIGVEKAIAEIEEYHKQTGRFLSFPTRTDKWAERLSGLWQRLRRDHPEHPTVAAWLKRQKEQEACKFDEAMKEVRAMAERGEKFTKSNPYLYLHRNHHDNPEFRAFHLAHCKQQRTIKDADTLFSEVEKFCERENRLPLKRDGESNRDYIYLQNHYADHPRMKALMAKYHRDSKSAMRLEESLKEIEQYYQEHGYLPPIKEPLGTRWAHIKQYYPDHPEVKRMHTTYRYKQSCAAYVIEDVKVWCEEHGELPNKRTNEPLYKLWYVARIRHRDNPEVIDLVKRYGGYRNQMRK